MIRFAASSLLLLLSGCMATAEPPPASEPAPPPAIQVVAATYGGNCKAPQGNVTTHLRQSCDGKQTCSYRVDYNVIGDPVYACPKDYVAEWRCSTNDAVRRAIAASEAGLGSIVELRCP